MVAPEVATARRRKAVGEAAGFGDFCGRKKIEKVNSIDAV
jgi:hypothetical protein